MRRTGYRTLLFDLDGTISETDSLHHPAWAGMLAPYGYDVDWPFYKGKGSCLVAARCRFA